MNTKLINLGLKGLFQHALRSIPIIVEKDYSKAMMHDLYAARVTSGAWVSLSFYWKEGDTIVVTTKGMSHIAQTDFSFDYNPKYGHDFEKLIPHSWKQKVSEGVIRTFLKAADTYNFETGLIRSKEGETLSYSMGSDLVPDLKFNLNPTFEYEPIESLVRMREKIYLLLVKVALTNLQAYIEHEIATQAHLSELGKPLVDFPHIQGDRLQVGLRQYGSATLHFVIPLPSGEELVYLVPESREDRQVWYKHIQELVNEELGSFDHSSVCRGLSQVYHNTNNGMFVFKPTPHDGVDVMVVDQSLLPWASEHTREISYMTK